MSNADYNEAQFEIEKAEAVKEARNAALEAAATECETYHDCGRDSCSVQVINLECAARIRALKTLAILLPLLFVFGVAAGETDRTKAAGIAPKVEKTAQSAAKRAQGPSSAVEYRRYQALKLTWQYGRGGLAQSAQDTLWADFQQSYADYKRARFIELGR